MPDSCNPLSSKGIRPHEAERKIQRGRIGPVPVLSIRVGQPTTPVSLAALGGGQAVVYQPSLDLLFGCGFGRDLDGGFISRPSSRLGSKCGRLLRKGRKEIEYCH